MFISDYVKTKYSSIYMEAATMYNEINLYHPKKPDLRKTVEFRRWKNDMAIQNNNPTSPIPRQKTYFYNHMTYPNITIEATTTTTSPPHITSSPPHIPVDLSATEIAIVDEPATTQNPAPRNPAPPKNQSPDHPRNKRTTGPVMQLNIPLMQIPTPTVKVTQQPNPIPAPAIHETVVDEGDQVDDLNPTVFDTIPHETMEKIIRELQNDPDLDEIMTDIENNMNVHEELVGLTVDLPDIYDPLEEELGLW